MSSTIATDSRNSFAPAGTRVRRAAPARRRRTRCRWPGGRPTRGASGPPPTTPRNEHRRQTTPPTAASAGSAAARRSRSSPTTSSRLISRPTTKKKIAISPSLTQCRRSSVTDTGPEPTVKRNCHGESLVTGRRSAVGPHERRHSRQQQHDATDCLVVDELAQGGRHSRHQSGIGLFVAFCHTSLPQRPPHGGGARPCDDSSCVPPEGSDPGTIAIGARIVVPPKFAT